MNLPCKFDLSLISLLPSLPELLRFPSLFNLRVGPDPPFCKLIIPLNVAYFHRSYDVMLVLQMINKEMSFLVPEKRTQRLLNILKHYKRSVIVVQSYLEKSHILFSSHLESTSLPNQSQMSNSILPHLYMSIIISLLRRRYLQ